MSRRAPAVRARRIGYATAMFCFGFFPRDSHRAWSGMLGRAVTPDLTRYRILRASHAPRTKVSKDQVELGGSSICKQDRY